MKQPEVCVVGLGYIGLPTAAILASKGLAVHGVDVNSSTVDAVSSGRVPFVEPDLSKYVERATVAGTLTASTEPVRASTYIVAVPTPFLEDHSADLSSLEAATRAIAKQLSGSELLILESTSPPGTTQQMANIVLQERPDLASSNLKFAHCPERVLPGQVMVELVTN
ncbi:MAG: NAD(P)-binding domain-containing protein, partial [Propionicimonas sp.]|nr:NAD(P)-binding domain-containing protein [Propionicimonas sp.]